MSIVNALQEKKCHFYNILSSDMDIGVIYVYWEEILGGVVYLHKMKIKLKFFGVVLFFYKRYEILFHTKKKDDDVYIIDTHPMEIISLLSTTNEYVSSLFDAINNPSQYTVLFSRLEWGKLFSCQECNALLYNHKKSIDCIEYTLSPSIRLTTIVQKKEQDILDEWEKEKYIILQNDLELMATLAFKQLD
jgi:hypothetical protein